jgi:glycosyltransferase involved in cell wall biosynthesis
MKILLWPRLYLPDVGGIEILTHRLGMQLRKMGHQVQILTEVFSSISYEERWIDGIKVLALPWHVALGQNNVQHVLENIKKAKELIETFKPDLINIHGWYETMAFYQLRVVKNIPVYLTIHGLLGQQNDQKPLCRQLFSQAQGVNAVSNALIEEIKQQHFQHPSLRMIYNGVDAEPKSLSKQQRERIVMICRLAKEKGVETAFYAMEQLHRKFPNARLCVIGSGDERNTLLALREKLHLENVIEMVHCIPHYRVSSWIDEASVVFVPSSYESFGLTAAEAAFRSRPVIASNLKSLQEVIEHEKTGLLVMPNNPDALAKATERLFLNPNLGKQMGLQGSLRASKLFSIEKCAEEYVKMYQNL